MWSFNKKMMNLWAYPNVAYLEGRLKSNKYGRLGHIPGTGTTD